MSIAINLAAVRGTAAPSVIGTFARQLARWTDALKRRRQNREARLALELMDDRLLRDIGLSRSATGRIVRFY